MVEARVRLPGSRREPVPAATLLGPLPHGALVEVTMVLRRRAPLPVQIPSGGVDRDAFAARYGTDPADLEFVTATVTAAGARVVGVDPSSRRVRVSGPAGVLQALFGTRLQRVRVAGPAGPQVQVRQRTGELSVPTALDGVVTAVLGLDDRPQARAYFHVQAAAAGTTSYTPVDLARIYQMPAGTDGTGQTLAIIELGGGFGPTDLHDYFTGLDLPVPAVSAVGVDGAVNTAGRDPHGADGEVLLDIEVAGGIAPASTLVVYFAPNTDAGFLDAVSTAAHADPTPTAISISWGQSEDTWTGQARTAMDQAFADAATMGVTVTAAAGDSGSSDTTGGGRTLHVDFPASSPHVLACGGTSLRADGATGVVASESVWNDGTRNGATGGGISDTFPEPAWQSSAGVPAHRKRRTTTHVAASGRGVPDVAADADPATGYQVLVDGARAVYGGTSAVAPLWAALTCRLAQAAGHRLGLLQPALYTGTRPGTPAPGFRDITTGSNGHYHAGPGWDPCTGLGVPNGTALLASLTSSKP